MGMTKDHQRIPTYQVDAFTDEPFKGNPAAVCLVDPSIEDGVMQSIATEMNLSETAFIFPLEEGSIDEGGPISLRWFTPKVEVPLCGHATLATAAVIFNALDYPRDDITFHTKSGVLTAFRQENGIRLDFPADRTLTIDPPAKLLGSMGISDYRNIEFAERGRDILVHLDDPAIVRTLSPDFNRMMAVCHGREVNGVCVTSPGEPPYDFISRFFAPWLGVDEDPVTGAAHTVLTPYWSRLLGKDEMRAFQASRRGGSLIVQMAPDNRVNLIGNAVILMRGELSI
jgi:PhzF family phenazine biosynthesis protein